MGLFKPPTKEVFPYQLNKKKTNIPKYKLAEVYVPEMSFADLYVPYKSSSDFNVQENIIITKPIRTNSHDRIFKILILISFSFLLLSFVPKSTTYGTGSFLLTSDKTLSIIILLIVLSPFFILIKKIFSSR